MNYAPNAKGNPVQFITHCQNVRAERLDIYKNFGHLLSKFYLHTSDVPIIKWILFIYLFIVYDTFIKSFLPTKRFFFAQIIV